jgi:uncharacterized protein (DUF1778 family)
MTGDALEGGISEPGENNVGADIRVGRLRRVPGGRKRQVSLCLTDDEYEALRSRADRAKVSVPRYLIEAALSGSASAAAEQRQLRRDVERTQLVLAGLANNVNQLAKWANTNRVLPDSFESALGDIGRATAAVTEAAQRVKGVFGAGR